LLDYGEISTAHRQGAGRGRLDRDVPEPHHTHQMAKSAFKQDRILRDIRGLPVIMNNKSEERRRSCETYRHGRFSNSKISIFLCSI
jgi:hypothetical protein